MKIIKFIFTFLCLLLMTISLHAQNKKRVHIGPHLHLKNAFLDYSSKRTHIRQNELNTSFGVSLFIAMSPKLDIRSGLRITRINASHVDFNYLAGCDFGGSEFDFTNSYYINHNRITYLGVPINANVKLSEGENHIYLSFGIEFLAKIDNQGNSTVVECGNAAFASSGLLFDQANMFVFKLNGGLGGEIKVSEKMKIFFEPQFEYSLGNIMSDRGGQANIANDIKVVELGMMVGLKF